MTNFKKSFGVSVLGLLALAFCCVLIAQSAIARSTSDILRATPYYEDGAVPLPGSDEVAYTKAAPKEKRSQQEPVAMGADAGVLTPHRTTRPVAVASAEQGTDTYPGTPLVGPFPVTVTGTTAGYAGDYISGCGSYDGAPDVVYSYTAGVSATIEVDLCASGYDTKVWVVESVSLTVIACNDDYCPGYRSYLSTPVTGGLTYYIVIGGWSPGDFGPYSMTVTEFIPGVDCVAAFPIEFDPGDGEDDDSQDYAIDISGGGPNSSVGVPNCMFWEFSAEASGLYNFTWLSDGVTPVAALTGIAGAIDCFYDRGDGNPPSPAAFALDYGGGPGPYTVGGVMLPGWTYILEIFDWGEGQTGTVTISRTELTSDTDECADIVPGGVGDLGVGNMTPFVHNVNATQSPESIEWCDNTHTTCGDVWFLWEADETGYVQFDMCEWGVSNYDSKIMVYRGGTCPGLLDDPDPFGCSDDGCGAFGDGGLIEVTCTAGEQFIIRLAGWFDGEGVPDDVCAQQGGQGTGDLDIYQTATSIRPANDDCPDAVVGAIPAGGGVYTAGPNNLYHSQWGSCPDLYNTPDGSIGPGGAMAWMVFDAFSIVECTDVRIDFCGQADDPGRVNYSSWPAGINLFTGCPCEGPFVTIPTAGGTYSGVCDPIDYPDVDFNFSRGWDFPGLLPGTYYWATSNWHLGVSSVSGKYIYPHDFPVNFRGTTVACTYCDAFANINSCPPVAGASWIDGVDLESISTSGTGCNSYEDHTADQPNPQLYKGITYELSVLMGKIGVAGEHDSCDVWIDWNQNSGFAAFVPEINERITLGRLALTWTADITPPLDAAEPGEGATGITMVRVRMASDADGMNVPCGEKVWGEVEDFLIEVATLECGDFDSPPNGIDANDIAVLSAAYFSGDLSGVDHWQRADIDGDGVITLADIIALVDAAYHGGAAICIS